jgi:translation elongation factor EF-1beta
VVEPSPLRVSAGDVEINSDELIQTLSQQMSLLVERKLSTLMQELAQGLMAVQLTNLTNQLKPELEEMVRQTLEQVRTAHADRNK